MKSTDSVQSVERAIDLLYCFTPQTPELTLKDFVQQTGLSRTTVFRLLNSLRNKNLIVKNETSNTYKLGFCFLNFGQIVSENLDLRQAALPFMNELARKTNETISLNVLQDHHRICIEKVDGKEDIRQFIRIGSPYPIIKGASGKLLLAFSEETFLTEILKEQSLNENEINGLLMDLHTIKKQGFAFSINERINGAFAISAPIFCFDGRFVGGLSISGLAARLSDSSKKDFVEELRNAASKISKELGC